MLGSALYTMLFTSIALMALGGVAVPSTVMLQKRINEHSGMDSRSNDHYLTFDDLHSFLFQHQPFPTAPQGIDVEDMFPETFFFHQKPVFLTDSVTPLSKHELHEAYTLFGKVHVANVEQQQYITLAPNARIFHHPYDGFRYYIHDQGLDAFVRRAQVYAKNFGRDAAVVALGPDIFRQGKEFSGRGLHSGHTVSWEDVSKAAPVPKEAGLRPSELRQLLRRDSFVKVRSEDHQAFLGLRFYADGSLQSNLFGALDNIEHDLNALL